MPHSSSQGQDKGTEGSHTGQACAWPHTCQGPVGGSFWGRAQGLTGGWLEATGVHGDIRQPWGDWFRTGSTAREASLPTAGHRETGQPDPTTAWGSPADVCSPPAHKPPGCRATSPLQLQQGWPCTCPRRLRRAAGAVHFPRPPLRLDVPPFQTLCGIKHPTDPSQPAPMGHGA